MDEGRRLSQSLLHSKSFSFLEKVPEDEVRNVIPAEKLRTTYGKISSDFFILTKEDTNETQRGANVDPERTTTSELDASSAEVPRFVAPDLNLEALLEEEQEQEEGDEEAANVSDLDASHFCEKLESALAIVRRLKDEKARLTQQLEGIRDDLNRNVG